jgi:hypothetical protein
LLNRVRVFYQVFRILKRILELAVSILRTNNLALNVSHIITCSKVNVISISMGAVNMFLVTFVENANKDLFWLIMNVVTNIAWLKYLKTMKLQTNNQKWQKNKKFKDVFLKDIKKLSKCFLHGRYSLSNLLFIRHQIKSCKVILDIL